jgi:flagellar motor switch protein FliM
MDKLVTQGWLAYQRKSTPGDKTDEIARGLSATFVDLDAYLAETAITVRELLNLQPGDILQTPKTVSGEIILQVHGENQFAGVMGRHKDNVAIKITRRAEVEEPL